MALEQTFQMLAGKAVMGGRTARMDGGRMRGEEIRFMLATQSEGQEVRHEFAGRIAGDAITGSVRQAPAAAAGWNATRVKRGSIDMIGKQ
jgi:hypothetical protein